MFDKFKQMGELKKMRDQAVRIQKELKKEKVEVLEDGVKVLMTGNQELEELVIDGMENKRVVKAINKAIKKSQKMAAKKLQDMSGGLGGLLGKMGG